MPDTPNTESMRAAIAEIIDDVECGLLAWHDIGERVVKLVPQLRAIRDVMDTRSVELAATPALIAATAKQSLTPALPTTEQLYAQLLNTIGATDQVGAMRELARLHALDIGAQRDATLCDGVTPHVRARTLLTGLWQKYDAGGISMGRSHEAVLLETAMDLLDDLRDSNDVRRLNEGYADVVDATRNYLSDCRARREGLPTADRAMGGDS